MSQASHNALDGWWRDAASRPRLELIVRRDLKKHYQFTDKTTTDEEVASLVDGIQAGTISFDGVALHIKRLFPDAVEKRDDGSLFVRMFKKERRN